MTLREYFISKEGKGIWKWEHYLDIYEQYFKKYVGKPVNILEIGVLAGGSLEMWRDYFGPQCQVYGIDNNPECKKHESERIQVIIGDQGEHTFWDEVKKTVPRLDIIIDDGSHRESDQVISLLELLSHMAPGGLYICEDTHSENNGFVAHTFGITRHLNEMAELINEVDNNSVVMTALQKSVKAVHYYPFMVIIEGVEKDYPLRSLRSGTEW